MCELCMFCQIQSHTQMYCELYYVDSYSYVHSVKSDSLILQLHIAILSGTTISGQRVMRLLSEFIIYSQFISYFYFCGEVNICIASQCYCLSMIFSLTANCFSWFVWFIEFWFVWLIKSTWLDDVEFDLQGADTHTRMYINMCYPYIIRHHHYIHTHQGSNGYQYLRLMSI